MALNDTAYEQSLKAALLNFITPSNTAKDQLAGDLAHAIAQAGKTFVMSGQVQVDSGIAVSTTGSPSAQTGATTAEGTGRVV